MATTSSKQTQKAEPSLAYYGCGDCNKKFVLTKSLSIHQRKVCHGPYKKKYPCKYKACEVRYDTKEDVIRHRVTVHGISAQEVDSQSQNATAEQTGSSNFSESFNRYNINFHGLPESKQQPLHFTLKCPYCNVSQSSKKTMKKHVKEAHPNQAATKALSTAASIAPFKAPSKAPSKGPSMDFHCIDCNREFRSATALAQHLRAKIHASRATLMDPPPNTCQVCNKTFKGAKRLMAHMASRVHNPLTLNLVCIRTGCKKKFDCPSAMLHHLEGGHCSKEIDRHVVNRVIVENDTTGIISNQSVRLALLAGGTVAPPPPAIIQRIGVDSEEPHHMTEYAASEPSDCDPYVYRRIYCDSDNEDNESGITIMTPNTSGGVSLPCNSANGAWTPVSTSDGLCSENLLTPTTSTVTRSRANSLSMVYLDSELMQLSAEQNPKTRCRCPLCPPDSHRRFSLAGLEAHMQSVAHAPKIFHCPVSILGLDTAPGVNDHMRSFSTLSGLVQHLESEACKGGRAGFEKVVKFIEEKMKELGLGGTLEFSGCGRTGSMVGM